MSGKFSPSPIAWARQTIYSFAANLGAALIGSNDAGTWFSGVVTKTVEALLQYIGRWMYGQQVSVFQYMTPAEIAAVRAYSFAVDVTAAVNSALADAWAKHVNCFAPPGGYLVTGLTLPGNFAVTDERDQFLRFYGAGYGNPFSTLNGGGTVWKSVTDAPILNDIALSLPNAQGGFEIHDMRFDGTSTTPVVKLNTMYGTSSFHHCHIYQRGAGDGFYLGYGATVEIHNNYSVNKDFANPVLGAARTGVGFNFPEGYGAGLVTFYKNSSRGWHDGFIIGASAGIQVAYHAKVVDCECSTVYNGIVLTAKSEYCTVDDCYFEGMDGGDAISDLGSYNKILRNNIFPGYNVGINASGAGFGGVIAWNTISMTTRPNTTAINAVMNGGLGRTITQNTIIWGSSGGAIVGVSGITFSGANPQIDLSGNIFSPKINWVGGAGSQQITDNSTSTLSAGSGVYGFGTASFNNLQIPMLNQGGISLALDPTTITAVAAGVCTLTRASSFLITFAGATNITSFTAPNIEGKFFKVRVTNGNCTFVNGASLKMAGAANYTPGANGATVSFEMHSNVAWEIGRTAY